MASTPQDEESIKDVQLLDRVLFKFAMVSDAAAVEGAVASFLVPVLSKLASPAPITRNKVLEVLNHISKRVRSQTNIKLPLADLVQQYVAPDASAFVQNLNIIYLEMAFDRATKEEQSAVAPTLLNGLQSRPAKHQAILLRLAVPRILAQYQQRELVREKLVIPAFFGDPAVKKTFLDFLLDVLLMVPLRLDDVSPQAAQSSPTTEPAAPKAVSVPGLSTNSIQRIMGSARVLTSQQLIEYKASIVGFLASGILDDAPNAILPHLLVASSDTHHSIKDDGTGALKKLENVNFEDPQLVNRLMDLFQGTPATDKSTPPEERRTPADSILREKILLQLQRSTLATNSFPRTLQIIFEAVFGATSPARIKRAGLSFVQAVFEKAAEGVLKPMSPLIYASVVKLLGQLQTADDTTENQLLRGSAYVTLGTIGKRMPHLLTQTGDLGILEMLFNRISAEPEAVRGSVQDALKLLVPAFKSLSDALNAKLETLLLASVERTEYQARLAAVQYAIKIFPFSHVASRFVCILGVSDDRPEVRDEAKRGLRPFVHHHVDIISDSAQPYPSFVDLVQFVSKQVAKRMEGVNDKNALPFPAASYEESLSFLLKCLRNNIQRSGRTWPEYLADLSSAGDCLTLYRDLLELGLGTRGGPTLHHVAAKSLYVTLYHMSDQQLAEYYTAKIGLFLGNSNLLYTGAHESREIIARIIGFSAPHLPAERVLAIMQTYLPQLDANEINVDKVEAAINTLAFLICRSLQSGSMPPQCKQPFEAAVGKLVDVLAHRSTQIKVYAVRALGIIGRYSPLPLPEGPAEGQSATGEGDATAPKVLTKGDLVKKLTTLLGSTTEAKLIEKLALALGYLCVGEPGIAHKTDILNALYGLDKTKSEEIHFSVGEALSCVASGAASAAAKDPLHPEIDDPLDDDDDHHDVSKKRAAEKKAQQQQQQNEAEGDDKGKQKPDVPAPVEVPYPEVMAGMLAKLFSLVQSGANLSRNAAAIWLLSLLQHSSTHPELRSKLALIQAYFSRLLADNNEVTQEVASKGLVMVYELGDAGMKRELVDNLVATLATGKAKQAAEVQRKDETEVIPEGALGAVPKAMGTGGLSTYKELCSVANELGQPDLIYRFLNLASHHSLWNSRKGAAFAATALASREGMEYLKPFLPTLVPLLYRSSYDPNPRVAQSMRNILNSITDARKAADEFFEPIMKELLKGLVSNVWRTRESSCYAISDALQSKLYSHVEPFLKELWFCCFRVIDDIKESVRKAAMSMFRTLSSLSVRLCDPVYTNPDQGKEAIAIIMPFLLTDGLHSPVKEVLGLTIDQIQKICKVAGPLLKPHVPEIVHVLVDSLTQLEPQDFNYLALHADKDSQRVLEQARVSLSRLSPLNDTLDLCVKYVDESNIGPLAKALQELFARGVGLPTKCGTAHMISSLTMVCPHVVKGEAPALLKALRAALKDKSPIVRSTYATAAAGLAPLTTHASLKHYVLHLKKLYTEGDEVAHVTSAQCLQALARKDAIKEHFKVVIPLVLLGKNDESEETRKLFKGVWEEIGTNSVVQLYLKEVLEALTESIGAASWALKKQGALTLAEVVESQSNVNAITPYLESLFALLLTGLKGRTWNGKSGLLVALASVCRVCKDLLLGQAAAGSASGGPKLPAPAQLLATVIAECKKRDKEYKLQAIVTLSSLLTLFPDIDVYSQVKEEIQDIAAGEIEEDEDEEASKGKEREEESSGEGGGGEESRKRKAIREKDRKSVV